jgi:hypothetical protein
MHYEIQVSVQDRARKRGIVRDWGRMREGERLGERMIGRQTNVEEGRCSNNKREGEIER